MNTANTEKRLHTLQKCLHTLFLNCFLFFLLFYFFNQGLEREFHQSHRNRSGFQPAEGGVSPVVWSADTRPSSPPDTDVSGWGGGNGLDIWSESTWRKAHSRWFLKSPRVEIVRFRSCGSGIINRFHLSLKATPVYPGCVKITGLCKHVRYSYRYF